MLASALSPLAYAQVASTSTTVLSDGNGNTVAVRNFPPKVQRGTLIVTAPPERHAQWQARSLVTGRAYPRHQQYAGHVWRTGGQQLVVNYLREPNGMLHDVWILTALEAQTQPVATP